MNLPRLQIRCPYCLKDGSARGELINQRITCKHCSHIFRAVPVEGDAALVAPPPTKVAVTTAEPINGQTPDAPASATTTPGRETSKQRIEALELEVRQLHAQLTAVRRQAASFANTLTPSSNAEETAELRSKLSKALTDAYQAQTQLASLEKAHADRERELLSDIVSFRKQLDQAVEKLAESAQEKQALKIELETVRQDLARVHTSLDEERRARRQADEAQSALASTANLEPLRELDHLRGEIEPLRQALLAAEASRQALELERVEAIEQLSRDAEAHRSLAEQAVRDRDEARSQIKQRDVEIAAYLDDLEAVRRELQVALDPPKVEGRSEEVRDLHDQLARLSAEAEGHFARDLEIDELRARIDRAESEIATQRSVADSAIQERDQLRVRLEPMTTEAETARDQLLGAQVNALKLLERLEEAEPLRVELDEARAEVARLQTLADRADEAARISSAEPDPRDAEIETLRAKLEAAEREIANQEALDEGLERLSTARGSARYDLELLPPDFETLSELLGADALGQVEVKALRDERDRFRSEAERLRGELDAKHAELAHHGFDFDLDGSEEETDAMLDDIAEDRLASEQARQKAELDALRKALDEARGAASVNRRTAEELASRFKLGEFARAQAEAQLKALSVDPVAIEANQQRHVDEAVKGAWLDFERRLSETQARLKAAQLRSDLLETEARQTRDELDALQQSVSQGNFGSDDDLVSMTNLRIMAARGTARLTLAEAESRIAMARQMAVDRKDKSLVDRINRIEARVREDLEARRYTLADTLVRGAEIEAGLDPGNWSIQGLKIFRNSNAIVSSLKALAPSFDRVMRQGNLEAIRSTIAEMRTVLGDQAGLPQVRRPGRVPSVKRPIKAESAIELFVKMMESESWLMRPIQSNRPLPESPLTTYASLIRACCDVREVAAQRAPARLKWFDSVIEATVAMVVRRQEPDGHFPFLDPRARPSPLALAVQEMVARTPEAVKEGWVVGVDPLGQAQVETGACGVALSLAGTVLGRTEWSQAALKAADWSMTQPGLMNFLANAATTSLLARVYLGARQENHLEALLARVSLSLLPGQIENGRWIDPVAAQTSHHLAILGALHDAWEAVPSSNSDVRFRTFAAIDRAFASLLDETTILGVSTQGVALRELIRHRDLHEVRNAPRLDNAILDSATVVQELCEENGKPKLGVAPDQLAALTRL